MTSTPMTSPTLIKPRKADKASAKKKRPWSGISLRKKKNAISESSPALNTTGGVTNTISESTKKLTNKKPGLIEGMKMKKAANQRRLSHAIIQNTNKVKEKVKDWFFKIYLQQKI